VNACLDRGDTGLPPLYRKSVESFDQILEDDLVEKFILGKKGDLSFDKRSDQRGISKGYMVAGSDKWSGFGDVFPSFDGNMENDA
jgi:hypothetical protein